MSDVAPIVSVITCCHNGERYLGDALDSVLAQGIAALEVVLVLNGSTDGSKAIAEKHAVRPRIAVQEVQGLPTAMNVGLSMARGEFITFLDYDDVWPPLRLAMMLDVLAVVPGGDCVYGAVVNTDEQLTPIREPVMSRLTIGMLIRRSAATRIGAFRTDLTHGGSMDWVARGAMLGLHFTPLHEVVTYRRIHGGNMGIRDRATARVELLRVIRDHHQRMRR